MAIYPGEDLIDVTTPDGRTLTLPRSLVPASMMPQQAPQQIAPAGFSDGQEFAGPQETPSVTGGALPVQADQIAPPAAPVALPEYNLATIDTQQLAKTRAVQQKQAAKQVQAQAAYQASPQGQMAGAAAQTQQGLDEEKTATAAAATQDAATQDVLAKSTVEHNQKLDELFLKRAQAAQASLDAEEAKNGEITATRKRIANTRIDRSADHPILAALGIALAGFGAAMRGDGSSPGLDVFWKAIDRKVANQMADLDQMGKVYGMQKEELASLKEMSNRRLELQNSLIAGEVDKAKRQLDEIAAKSASEKTRANAKIFAAQLDQRAAAAHQDAVRWGLDYDQKERAEKNQNSRFYSGLHEQRYATDLGAQLKREDNYLDYQKALLADRAKGDELAYKAKLEMIKDNETRGLRNVITKEALLTPRGRAMMDEADKLEADAAKFESDVQIGANGIPTPDVVQKGKQRADMMREKAQIIRGNAQIQEQVRDRDPVQSGKLQDQYSVVQNVTTQVDKIKELYDGPDGGKAYVANSPVQQEIASRYGQILLAMKDVQGLGVLSKQDTSLLQKELGMDPTSEGWTAGNLASIVKVKLGKDPEGFKRALDSVIDNAQNDVYLKMNGTNFGGTKEELFYRRKPAENTPEAKAAAGMVKEKTPLEAESAARTSGDSTIAKVGRAGYQTFVDASAPSYAQEAEQAANGSLSRPGFSDKQATDFDTLVASYKTGTPRGQRAGDLLVAQVANSADTRPELAAATLKNLKQYAPELYVKARAAIPQDSDVAKQMDYEEKSQIGVAQIATPMLVEQLRATGYSSDEIKRELARRATSDKDKAAAAALLETVQQTSRNNMPKGSVFRGGR